jgi:hypothetical protein
VLALLAFAGLPPLAHAEDCDSSCVQYNVGEGGIPKSGVKDPQHPKSGGGSEPISTPNKPSQGGGEAQSPETGDENESQGKHAGGGGGSPGSNGNPPARGGGGTKPEGRVGLGGAQEATTEPQPGQLPYHSSGGSSPLVPILIAVALLAALSIGAAIFRQRRHVPVG